MAERKEYPEKSQNHTQNHEEVWTSVGDPSSQEVGKPRSTGTQVREPSEKAVPG